MLKADDLLREGAEGTHVFTKQKGRPVYLFAVIYFWENKMGSLMFGSIFKKLIKKRLATPANCFSVANLKAMDL